MMNDVHNAPYDAHIWAQAVQQRQEEQAAAIADARARQDGSSKRRRLSSLTYLVSRARGNFP